MLEKKNKPIGIISLLLTALIWGLAFTAQRTATGTLGAISINTFRFVFASSVLAVFCLILDIIAKKKNQPIIPWTKETVVGGILLGFILFLGNNLQQYGLEFSSAGKAGFITGLYIVFVPIFSLLARRKPSLMSFIAVVIAIGGFFMISVNETFTIDKGDLMLLLSAFIFAFHIIFTDIFAKDSDPVRLTLMQMFSALIISIPALFIAGIPSASDIKANIVPLLYIGFISSGIGFTLQTFGQKKTEPSLATLLMSLESVFALIFGTIILKEYASARELTGCLCVFIGVFLAQMEFPEKFLKFKKNSFFVC